MTVPKPQIFVEPIHDLTYTLDNQEVLSETLAEKSMVDPSLYLNLVTEARLCFGSISTYSRGHSPGPTTCYSGINQRLARVISFFS